MRLIPFLAALAALSAGAQTPTYRVYPAPVESPNHTTPLPPADARVALADPSDPLASPFGWHDTDGVAGADTSTAVGNNVAAFFDLNGNSFPEPGETPDGGPTLVFDFPLDLTSPIDFPDALVTNVFYWLNVLHDVTYHHGFTEAAGNFQTNNYDRGGLGSDAVRAGIPRGGGGGASMSTPADGSSPRLTIGGFMASRPGALDAAVLVHELGHGISSRLTGGPSNPGCLSNAEQAGEGWSDFYGLIVTMRPDHTGAGGRTVGTWLMGQGPEGAGVRPAPYSTSFATNGYTYEDTRTAAVPHGVGFVWATILWEVMWELISESGFDPDLYDGNGTAGNQMALSLVTTGLALQPCNPGFVDARDAILAADMALYAGANSDLLWAGFARRGLGWSASQGSSQSNADNTEAFDLPPTTPAEPGAPAPALALHAPTPNPVGGRAHVRYELPRAGRVRLTVVDLSGREVAVLEDGQFAAGSHMTLFDGHSLAGGVYVLRLAAAGGTRAQRVVVAPAR